MSIVILATCDKCGNYIDEHENVYCSECYDDRFKKRIEYLEEQLKRFQMKFGVKEILAHNETQVESLF